MFACLCEHAILAYKKDKTYKVKIWYIGWTEQVYCVRCHLIQGVNVTMLIKLGYKVTLCVMFCL